MHKLASFAGLLPTVPRPTNCLNNGGNHWHLSTIWQKQLPRTRQSLTRRRRAAEGRLAKHIHPSKDFVLPSDTWMTQW